MAHLPELLRRYYERCVDDVPPAADGAVITQRGEMRLAEERGWKPFTAEQWLAAREVAFCWHARVKMAPLVTAVVEDAFENGHGRLDAKMWGVVPVAHERGIEIDRGEVQRYLAELPWNPTAIVHNPALRFEARGDAAVRVLLGDAYVDLSFDEHGDVVTSFTESRSRGTEGSFPWEGTFMDYEMLGGVRVPTRAEVAWHMPAGKFTYWRATITDRSWRLPPAAPA